MAGDGATGVEFWAVRAFFVFASMFVLWGG